MSISGFLPGIFSGGGEKSIVMQIFLLFSDQISEGQKSPRGGRKPDLFIKIEMLAKLTAR